MQPITPAQYAGEYNAPPLTPEQAACHALDCALAYVNDCESTNGSNVPSADTVAAFANLPACVLNTHDCTYLAETFTAWYDLNCRLADVPVAPPPAPGALGECWAALLVEFTNCEG